MSITQPSMDGGLNRTVPSTNWSGYAVTGGNGAFRGVSATWIQPKAICRTRGVRALAAFWVGLDGDGSASVEQTGTDSDCNGRIPAYYGWYEMYPAPPVLFRTKVNPGDHISASVTFHGTETFVLVLRDITRGWTHVITKNAANVSRSSAEVITEAPSSLTGVLPLADFGSIRYAASRADGKLFRDLAPVRIIMVDGGGMNKDLTSLIGSAGAFGNTWLRSN